MGYSKVIPTNDKASEEQFKEKYTIFFYLSRIIECTIKYHVAYYSR